MKGFGGVAGSHQSDGGTSSRVFGSFLSWLQERTAPVFVVATANEVRNLPPELLRKGRFDEIFFVDLPNQDEREAIWRIQIGRYGRSPENFRTAQLAGATAVFTGAEIEQLFRDALYEAFGRDTEPTDLSISMVLGDAVPLSRLKAEELTALRKWAQGRARPSSAPEPDSGQRRMHTSENA